MWTAVSGASAQAQAVDTVANNLANSDTLGFKKDVPTFKEYLATYEREPSAQEVPRKPIQDKDFYPLDNKDQAFVVVDGTYSNFRTGHLQVTQNPLDLAMDGKGFFEISTPSGVRYTRQGSFKVAMDGKLVTNEGFPVLASQPGGLAANPVQPNTGVQPGQGGPETQGGVAAGPDPTVAARFINLKDRGAHFSISESGDLYVGDNLIAKIRVAEFKDLSKLRKSGGQNFENTDPNNYSTEPQKTIVRQGVLETSNVNPVEEMTNLIKANRMFEHGLKSIKTYNELLGKEANDIGKL